MDRCIFAQLRLWQLVFLLVKSDVLFVINASIVGLYNAVPISILINWWCSNTELS